MKQEKQFPSSQKQINQSNIVNVLLYAQMLRDRQEFMMTKTFSEEVLSSASSTFAVMNVRWLLWCL